MSSPKPAHRAILCLESLESRETPATLVSPTKLTYQDADGDAVTITLSKPLLTAGNVGAVFGFDGGGIGNNATKQQLQRIDVTALGAAAASLNITATAVRNAATNGDGQVHVGHIRSLNIDLGTINVAGDIAQIDAGDSNPVKPAIASVTARSLGRFGGLTQPAGEDLIWDVVGALGSLTAKGDVVGVELMVNDGADGTIGPITIGGSLVGTDELEGGVIFSSGKMGAVKIAHDLLGGTGDSSGVISSAGDIASVSIGGSVVGGLGISSGRITSSGNVGAVKIGRNLAGGTSNDTGLIQSQGKLASLNIGGSILGNTAERSGFVQITGEIGPITIARDVRGGVGSFTGAITAGKIGAVSIGGSLTGGDKQASGYLSSGSDIKSVRIGHDLRGGIGVNSGQIDAGKLGAVTIGGSVVGGEGEGSGAIQTTGKLASLSVGGSILGNTAERSGYVHVAGEIGPVTISRDVRGGDGSFTGAITAAKIGPVSIGGSLVGGDQQASGYVSSGGDIASVRIGHDLRGGTGSNSGQIDAGKLGAVTIAGSVVGGPGEGSGAIQTTGDMGAVKIGGDLLGADNSHFSGRITSGGRIAGVTLGGSMIAGFSTIGVPLTRNASIRAQDDIGFVTIGGSVIGREPNFADLDGPSIIAARGQRGLSATAKTDLAIGRITIGGDVHFATIAGGIGLDGEQNADAQIGAVVVGGDWVASSIVSGAVGGTDNPNITSKIASIVIAGIASGTPESEGLFETFGFASQHIGSLRINGHNIALIPGAGNDTVGIELGLTGDLVVIEMLI